MTTPDQGQTFLNSKPQLGQNERENETEIIMHEIRTYLRHTSFFTFWLSWAIHEKNILYVRSLFNCFQRMLLQCPIYHASLKSNYAHLNRIWMYQT